MSFQSDMNKVLLLALYFFLVEFGLKKHVIWMFKSTPNYPIFIGVEFGGFNST